MQLPAPFDALSPTDQGVLSEHLDTLHLTADTTIFASGDEGDATYLVDSGAVRLELPRPELDSDGVLAVLGAGSVLGELSLLDGLPRSATAVTEGNVTLRRLSAASLDSLTQADPPLGAKLLRALGQHAARKLRQTNTVLAEHVITDGRDPAVDAMVARAQEAQREIESWTEERIDRLLLEIAEAVAAHAEVLAKETVEETRLGDVADKTVKNVYASMAVYQSIAGARGYGPLGAASARGVTDIAAPVGVIFGLVPQTNPVATAVFKALISLKARNALILSFNRACMAVGNRTGEVMHDAMRRQDAPTDLLQWIKVRSDRRRSQRFMSHEGVSLVLATGGPGMVQAAYSSGTPAIGVGAGNAPAWVTSSAAIDEAAQAIVRSKSFDNGLICGSEHNLVVDTQVRSDLLVALEEGGAAVLDQAETAAFLARAVSDDGRSLRPELIGQSAQRIAQALGVSRPYDITLIVVPGDFDPASALAGEKMAPVLSLFTVTGEDEGLALCLRLLAKQGAGHTAIIHATDEALVERFGLAMPASRILVNCPGSQGVSGLASGLVPSFTLGCGTFGGNATTDNVSFHNLQNIKRLARGLAQDDR